MTAKSFLLSLRMLYALKTKKNSANTHTYKKSGRGIPMYALRLVGQYSCFIKVAMSNTTLRLERKRHASYSH